MSAPLAIIAADSTAAGPPPQVESTQTAGRATGLVARNTLALVVSQFVTTPVSPLRRHVRRHAVGAGRPRP